ncbi:hypothetical protein [Streptomyces sp. V1I1]|uniref:hypothetical protein n=1 Tax=Streptomyces sp. V1I1 TaxID=3042272 RepID=UPI0027D778FA|nr:hypothetical protein [Streptomyces sp. V1I1]
MFGPPPPAEPLRAVAMALLNLSGLGLGYVLLRRWIPAVLCWIATAVLLLIALPADPDGIPGGLFVGYVLFLLLAAADGARSGLRGPAAAVAPAAGTPAGPALLRPSLIIALGVVLLAVPAGGAVAYDAAVEQMLLDRLADADELVEKASASTFTTSAEQYKEALTRYRELAEEHEGSRAAKLVPDRLESYYETVAAPYEKGDHCNAVLPLTYLRTVPDTVDEDLLGDDLAKWPDERLATSLYECGVSRLGLVGAGSDGGELGELMRTFPDSPQAEKVEPAFRARIKELDGQLSDGYHDPCDVTQDLERLGETASRLPGESATTLARATDGPVESGTYACGVDQFKEGEFAEARGTLTDFADTYPNSKRRGQAQNIAIAAEIAEEDAAAGKRVPSGRKPGGSGLELVISNDAPDDVEILFTGPVTGKITLKGCSGCTTYASESSGRSLACQDSSRNYPKKRLLLPTGNYHFLYKRSDTTVSNAKDTSKTKIESGYSYTDCTYIVKSDSLWDIPPPNLPEVNELSTSG